MKYFIILFSLIIFSSCCHHNTKDKSFENTKINYRKTACFGACPTFSLNIYGNGILEYTGIANVKNIGDFNSSVSKEELEEILSLFDKADFWNLKDKYTDNITDLPSTFITYDIGTKMKVVEDYYGGPKDLKVLEKHLDNLIEKKIWTKK